MSDDVAGSMIPHASEIDTLIIGGGVAGLACARTLKDAGLPFALVTDALGGRLALSRRGHYLGAAMLNDDHVHMKRWATPSIIEQAGIFESYMWNGKKPRLTLLNASPLGIWRGFKAFGPFLASMKKLRREMPHTCITELVANDALLSRLVLQSAEDFAREHKIEKISEKLFGPAAGAIYMCDWREMNAFFFCLGATWIGLGSPKGNGLAYYDWSSVVPRLTEGCSEQIVIDAIESLGELDGGAVFEARSSSRNWVAKNLVLALPGPSRTAFGEAVGVEDANPARLVELHVFHIAGKRRRLYKPGGSILFGMDQEVALVFVLPDGDSTIDVLYATTGDPNLSTYYEDYEVLEYKRWSPSVQLTMGPFRKLQPKPNVFMIGDHNIGGLEESFLTGLFAANRIIAGAANA